jgi:hypothetical protein
MRMPRILATIVAVSALVVGVMAPAASASAAGSGSGIVAARDVKTTLVGFNPGNMMSDAVFTAKDTMTEAQIQAFFNSKVSRCLGGIDEEGNVIRCLKDFTESSVNRPADAYCNGYTGAMNESAARIIYRVAQSCGINPQVLIVMLQKEQSLVTHTWPSGKRFRAALGQGCPDGGVACNPAYVGFFHQIYGAARQMQIYMEGRYFTYYAPGKTWNIYWQAPVKINGVWSYPCGSGPVYVANKATAALYYYTPYQPNAAALAAGYGLGDSCSAYGNRNFYNYFTDWFGSTQVPRFMTPTLASTDSSPFIVGADSNGDVWGYPYLSGAWGDRVRLATGVGGVKQIFGVGDLNGDGNRDFIVFTASGGAKLLRSNGSKTLLPPVDLAGDWSGVRLVTPAGDFDGDGIPDLFTTDVAGRLFLWSGNDRGGFSAPKQVGNGWAGFTIITGNGDLDGDGKPDLVGRDSAGRLQLFLGDGKGGWKGSKQIGNGWGGFTNLYNVGDFTGDGYADILAVEPGGSLRLFRGSAGGWLSDGRVIGTGWHTLASAGAGAPVSGTRALPGGAGNLDGIYGRDIVGLTDAGELRIYGTTGNGNWGSVMRPPASWSASDRVFPMGDFTGDGISDIGQIDSAGVLYLHPGKVGGGFAARVQIGTGWSGFTRVVGGIDFDGNRTPDVLAVDSQGLLKLFRGDGAGGWANGSGITIGQGWAGFRDLVAVGDFDGDGTAELLGRTTTGALILYPTTGDGNWGTPKQIGQGWGSMAYVLSNGDFNGDGNADIIGVSTTGDMYLYRGNGRGGFSGNPTKINAGWQIMTQVF